MPFFAFSKVDKYRNSKSNLQEDVIDLDFPNDMMDDTPEKKSNPNQELLIFVVDDDPFYMQILNTHFSKLRLTTGKGVEYSFRVRNFATGASCINALGYNPDVILLDYNINKDCRNALGGRQTLDRIIEINPNQKVMILNELNENLRGAFMENGLRDYIIKDQEAVSELNGLLKEVLEIQ